MKRKKKIIKTELVVVTLTPEERETLKELAQSRNETISDYSRRRIFS